MNTWEVLIDTFNNRTKKTKLECENNFLIKDTATNDTWNYKSF